jgi:ubiquinone biosynthesis protein COQ9
MAGGMIDLPCCVNGKALAVMSLPQNIGSSMQELASLSDEMWFLAGDRSVDFNWYTKRATLSAVYSSTGWEFILFSKIDLYLELFMTTDSSGDFEDTFGTFLIDLQLTIQPSWTEGWMM